MLKTRIIPCLDVKDGRVVKGTNFINLRDAGDPVEIAKLYNDKGADELCFLDISASQENRTTTYDIVKKTAEKCFMPLTVGGGVRQVSEVEKLLNHGADKVSFNSAAVSSPQLISNAANKFGSQCIVVAIDAKFSPSKNEWEVFTHGGTRSTGIRVTEFAKIMEENGAGEILLTSMDQDGVKDGYDIKLLRTITQLVGIPVIASGGAGKVEHFLEAVRDGGASALLAASVFHFNEITIAEVKEFLNKSNVPMRMT
jgi:cyclase